MKKITFCNYYGMCDSDGNVLGHTAKVTNEYGVLLREAYNIELISSPCIANAIDESLFSSVVFLPFNIYSDKKFTMRKRILDKFKVLENIHKCFKYGGDVLFFLQVDFFFFLYVFLINKSLKYKNKKVYCLIYHQSFTAGRLEGIFQCVFKRALNKLDGVFYTQPQTKKIHKNAIWIPDYYYDIAKYEKYDNAYKENQVACLGTMNRYKHIEELIDVWDYEMPKLLILGRFDSEERFLRLRKYVEHDKKSNIVIENRILEDDEYYSVMGSSKYTILPYDMNQYTNRTSGVMQESVFVGSVVIAPKELLEYNGISGFGYNDFYEIKNLINNDDWSSFIRSNRFVKEKYSKVYVREMLEQMLNTSI